MYNGVWDTRDLVFVHFRLQTAPVLPGRRSVLLPRHVLSSDGLLSALHQVFREGSETKLNFIHFRTTEETALHWIKESTSAATPKMNSWLHHTQLLSNTLRNMASLTRSKQKNSLFLAKQCYRLPKASSIFLAHIQKYLIFLFHSGVFYLYTHTHRLYVHRFCNKCFPSFSPTAFFNG